MSFATFSLDKIVDWSTSNLALCLHRDSRLRSFAAAFIWNECVIVPWNGEAKDDDHHGQVCQNESCNVHRIVAKRVELWIGEAEDDGQDWPRDISKEEGQESRYLPVFSLSDDDIEITSNLVALYVSLARVQYSSEKTYRVEGHEPKLARNNITVPKRGGSGTGSACDDRCNNGKEHIEASTCTGANSRAVDAVR